MGYSYKPGLGDTRETPVAEMTRKLRKYNCELLIWDPLVDRNEFPDETLAVNNPYEVEEIDIIILATAHQEILDTDWAKLRGNCNTPIIYDGRRVLDKFAFIESGWSYYGVGMPIKVKKISDPHIINSYFWKMINAQALWCRHGKKEGR